ncbi:MAG: hypothetical protein IPO01_12885 [Chitinophagaceae bacterium]|nr:hypothetical protein [Chitinophagaceae bacterium]
MRSFHILTSGYQPILAHPERYFYFQTNFKGYKKLKDLGFILQVNLLSLACYYGKNAAQAGRYLLDEGLASLAGTDLHHGRHLSAFQLKKNLTLFNRYHSNDKMINQRLLS